MGYGYQKRDYEIIDYQLWEMEGFNRVFRGPKPEKLEEDKFFTCLGGAQTFGCFVEKPFPLLLSENLNLETLNTGHAGAGPLFYLKKKEHVPFMNKSKFVIVQVMSGRSESNSVFESKKGRGMLERRSDKKQMAAEQAYNDLLQSTDEDKISEIIAETRENYVNHMIELLNLIKVPKVLFWFSKRMPEYEENLENALELFGKYPQLVNRGMIEQIRPFAEFYVESVSSVGLPQPLKSRFTDKETTVSNPSGKKSKVNNYYPSPQMHELAFEALLPVCLNILDK